MRTALFSKIFNFILIFLIALVFDLGIVHAESGQFSTSQCNETVFGVSGIKVDQRAETASLARERGVRKAAEHAFDTILQRLLRDRSERESFANSHDLDQFSDFVQIVEENSLKQRYIAKLDFCFDADRLRTALMASDLRWAELRSPRILLIPVWRGPEGVLAWHSDNGWIRDWWKMIDTYDGLLSLTRLEKTLTNERRFRGESLIASDPGGRRTAAELADAEQIILVEAALDFVGADSEISVYAKLFDRTGSFITTVANFEPQVIDDFESLDTYRYQTKIIEKVENIWHSSNLIDGSSSGLLTVMLPIMSLAQWASRLAALDKVVMIQDYDILSLDTKRGIVSLRLAGSREAFENALSANRLKLREKK